MRYIIDADGFEEAVLHLLGYHLKDGVRPSGLSHVLIEMGWRTLKHHHGEQAAKLGLAQAITAVDIPSGVQ